MSNRNPLRYAIAILIALLGAAVAYAAFTTPGLSLLLWGAAAIVLAGVLDTIPGPPSASRRWQRT